MPYIEPNSRHVFDPQIEKLGRVVDQPGELNYVISRLLSLLIARAPRANYRVMNEYLGAVRGAATEFERRVLSEYEERARSVNGDVFGEVLHRLDQGAARRLDKIARGER